MTAAVELPAEVTHGGGRPTVYLAKDGKRVPGVTTVLGAFKDPGPLMAWAHKLGAEGIDFRQARDDAADVGHYAHGLIHAAVHLTPLPPPPKELSDADVNRAMQALDSFYEWRDQKRIRYVDTERPYVSELHRVGGTYDLLALMGDKDRLILVDYKSGNRIYREHVAQLAAYAQLLRENTGKVVDGAVALRIGKEFGTFSDHFFPPDVLEIGWRRFLAAKWVYEVDKELKKAASL